MILTSMLALPFTWTSAGSGADGQVRLTGGTWRACTIPSGTYRMLLGTSAGTVQDFVRAVTAALNSALSADGVTVAGQMTSDGHTDFACASALDLDLPAEVNRLLGDVNGTNGVEFFSSYQPQHVSFPGAAYGPQPEMQRAGGWETTVGGVTYGFAAGPPAWRWLRRVRMLPLDPTQRSLHSTDASPVYPDDAYKDSLGVTTTARMWSWMDVLVTAGSDPSGVPAAWCQSTYQTMLTSTTETYRLCYLDAETLATVAPAPQDEAWNVWHHLDLVLRLPSSASVGTRA